MQEPEVATVDLEQLLNTSAYRSTVIVIVADVPCAVTTAGTGSVPGGR
jgi:hypothetical protein